MIVHNVLLQCTNSRGQTSIYSIYNLVDFSYDLAFHWRKFGLGDKDKSKLSYTKVVLNILSDV